MSSAAKRLGLGCLALVLAFLALAVLLSLFVVFFALAHRPTRDVNVSGPTSPPRLVFACELDAAPLAELFADPSVIQQLRALNAGVALALKDFGPQRTSVVQQLNQAGVPITAWLALSKEQGYYFNAGNAPEASTRYQQFREWTDENHLKWSAVGLDIEPNLSEFGAFKDNRLSLLRVMARRVFDRRRIVRANQQYSALIHQIQSDGYPVQTYQFVILADERKAKSTLLQRMLGLVDVRGNDEVFMAYTSFNHSLDSALVWVYGPDAQVLAVGSTGSSGDPQLDARFPPLNWMEFSRDLIVAARFTPVVAIYSLEGCVRQDFLARLKEFNWNQTVSVAAGSVAKVQRFRRALQTVLWTASHLPLVLPILLLCGWILWRVLRQKFGV